MEQNDVSRPVMLAKRRPLRTTFSLPNSAENGNCTPSFLITLKPPEMREFKENQINERFDDFPSRQDASVSRDLFVFGQPHPDRGFSFKMNQWLCGIGSSVKKFFGFK